ncbi:hypothetical protein HS088_TW14G01073 [Tripterygium wilfordii]|uniref:J domain-containing protein n=1 Tax=Tripterygium wilfordii TaxID=458696 RepID=A0A7J7CSE6_TRIWF|nr:uncharacterized protein LOC120014937 [Tripterygium wilfordii]XP_038723000.1 uncharacterized protein LOC120014937 [Tripterygium wilfordii]KAF5736918.1 hypothetical protein HS088_TW14G01073 [Tripterygium wilfordii]
MECNKEEAIRAKVIAETKMQHKEFMSARKFILKAQKLYSNLESISQMLVVCDVHCSAEIKFKGNEIDWYEVLQIEQTADDASIKKQYRKFALQLHPDKNKFPGAEAAFKLIGEAQRVLLDRQKRSVLDVKLKSCLSNSAPSRVPQRASGNANIGAQSNPGRSSVNLTRQHQQPKQPAQSGVSNGFPTFWTVCPFCAVKYQYYREVINRPLRCHTCDKPFIAYDCGYQGASPATNLKQPTFPQQNDVPNQAARNGSFSAEHSKKEVSQKTAQSSEAGSKKGSGKRKRKQVSESSESCDTENGSNTREDEMVDEDDSIQAGQNLGCNREQIRRSERRKQRVSYNENLSDDEQSAKHPKEKKSRGLSCDAEEDDGDVMKKEESKTDEQSGLASGMNAVLKEMKREEDVGLGERLQDKIKEAINLNGTEKIVVDDGKKSFIAPNDSSSDLSSRNAPDVELFEYPDPDFHDFDEDRKEDCFAVGQIWAIYDTLEAMPRFYALIRKVFSPGFKLRITWLEPDPDDKYEIEWNDEGLPVACGKFKLGDSEYTEQQQMFSHLMDCEKGSQRNAYKVFPRKGETWALFKNWNIKWKSITDTHQNYEYEFVEILSDYNEDRGTYVAYLGKVKGYASIFCRMVKESTSTFQIPPSELFRFAYRVPSFPLTGEESEGVTKGSFELDPASLPTGLEEIDVPEELKVEAGSIDPSGLCSKPSDEIKDGIGSEASTFMDRADGEAAHLEPRDDNSGKVGEDYSAPPSPTFEDVDIPEPEFCNFEAYKSVENFQVGQIWSLYSEEDGLPKYYGQITKVVTEPSVKLQLKWLAHLPADTLQWFDKDVPICCGKFKITNDKDSYASTNTFSHQMRAEPAGKKNECHIFPRKGEVWALFKNLNPEMKCSELEHCKYDIVHVLEENDLHLKVSLLERVDGFNLVFKAQLRKGSVVTRDIRRVEQLRFSHQIPAFQLTEERGGGLRGCWELDPNALPVHYFA